MKFQLYGLLNLIKHRNYDVWERRGTHAKTEEQAPEELSGQKSSLFVVRRKANLSRYLGFPEAEKSYKRFLAALLENPALPLQVGRNDDILVAELTDGFLDGVESRMGADAVVMFKLCLCQFHTEP